MRKTPDRIGQLAIISAMVILIGAALGFLLEVGAPGTKIQDFGHALWWSAALVTTVSSELYPVTAAGRVLGFVLMIYAIGTSRTSSAPWPPCSWPRAPGQHRNPGRASS